MAKVGLGNYLRILFMHNFWHELHLASTVPGKLPKKGNDLERD